MVLHRTVSLRAMGERGREGEPIEWIGWVCCRKVESEANPALRTLTAVPSVRKDAEVIGAQAAKKRLSPETGAPVPQTDTGRQGESSPGERATLC